MQRQRSNNSNSINDNQFHSRNAPDFDHQKRENINNSSLCIINAALPLNANNNH